MSNVQFNNNQFQDFEISQIQAIEMTNSLFALNKFLSEQIIQEQGFIFTYISQGNFINFEFQSNQFGLIISRSNEIIINNSNFQLNQNSPLELKQINKFKLKLTNFQDNKGLEGGGLRILDSYDGEIKNSLFLNNTAIKNGGGIFIINSIQIIINKSDFSNNNAYIFGGAIYEDNTTYINYFKCLFQNNSAKNIDSQFTYGKGGAVYLRQQQQQKKIINSHFIENKADIEGGSLYIYHLQDLFIFDCLFDKNNAQIGSAIYAENVQNNIEFNDIEFYNQNQDNVISGCLQIIQAKNIVLEKVIFNSNFAMQEGSALNVKNINNLLINNSYFTNNKLHDKINFLDDKKTYTQKGGTIYADQINKFTIKNSIIEKSFSYHQGGCIYLNNINNQIINNSTISQCYTQFNAQQDNSQKIGNYMISMGGCIFFQNFNDGETIYMDINSTIFQECQSSSGGGLLLVKNDKNQQFKINIRNNQFVNLISDLGPVARFLGFQINDSKNIIENQFLNSNYSNYYKNNQNLINFDKVVNKTLVQFQNQYTFNEIRISKFSNLFKTCDTGSFISENSEQGNLQCEKCRTDSVCEGGYLRNYPLKHYWRKDIYEDKFLFCKNNKEACLGNDVCNKGYKGILCEQCEKNYVVQYDNKCSHCDLLRNNFTINLIIQASVTIFFILLQIYGISVKIRQYQYTRCINNLWMHYIKKQSMLQGIIKILISHMQIMFLFKVSHFGFNQQTVTIFNSIANPVQGFKDILFCSLQEDQQDKKVLYNFLISIAICIGLVIISHIFLLLFYLFRQIRSFKILLLYFFASYISIFILIQPGIVQNSLNFLVCRNVVGGSYSTEDLSIKCVKEYYLLTIVPINMVILTLSAFVIPSIFMYILIVNHRKQNLQNVKFSRQFGLFYMDLKLDLYLYDFGSMFLKCIIAAFSVIYKYEVIIKASMMSITIGLYQVICFKWPQHEINKLNYLHQYQNVVQILSILLEMCRSTLSPDDVTLFEIIAPILIITLNISFFVFVLQLLYLELQPKLRLNFLYLFPKSKWGISINKTLKNQNQARKKWNAIMRAIRITNRKNDSKNFINQYRSKLFLEGCKQFSNSNDLLNQYDSDLDLVKKSQLFQSEYLESFQNIQPKGGSQKNVQRKLNQSNLHKSMFKSQYSVPKNKNNSFEDKKGDISQIGQHLNQSIFNNPDETNNEFLNKENKEQQQPSNISLEYIKSPNNNISHNYQSSNNIDQHQVQYIENIQQQQKNSLSLNNKNRLSINKYSNNLQISPQIKKKSIHESINQSKLSEQISQQHYQEQSTQFKQNLAAIPESSERRRRYNSICNSSQGDQSDLVFFEDFNDQLQDQILEQRSSQNRQGHTKSVICNKNQFIKQSKNQITKSQDLPIHQQINSTDRQLKQYQEF